MRVTQRERTFLILGAVALALTAFYVGVFEPVATKLDQFDKRIALQSVRHRELLDLTKKYTNLKEAVGATERKLTRSRGFSIMSHLENLAVKTEVKDRVVQMKPKQGQTTRYYKENLVEIKMEKVTLTTLVKYLNQIETSPELLRIREMKVKPRFDNANMVDAVFTISAFEIIEAGQA